MKWRDPTTMPTSGSVTAGDDFDGFYGCLLLVGQVSFALITLDAVF
ncbi:hypothetical protein T261_3341 [Streptomyces lydicus]|nr:hypothetical protein T261_3341 [Streptomyces lydicus]